jgi:hypothetical protein
MYNVFSPSRVEDGDREPMGYEFCEQRFQGQLEERRAAFDGLLQSSVHTPTISGNAVEHASSSEPSVSASCCGSSAVPSISAPDTSSTAPGNADKQALAISSAQSTSTSSASPTVATSSGDAISTQPAQPPSNSANAANRKRLSNSTEKHGRSKGKKKQRRLLTYAPGSVGK